MKSHIQAVDTKPLHIPSQMQWIWVLGLIDPGSQDCQFNIIDDAHFEHGLKSLTEERLLMQPYKFHN